jgi:hypothetical protein
VRDSARRGTSGADCHRVGRLANDSRSGNESATSAAATAAGASAGIVSAAAAAAADEKKVDWES